MTQREYEAAREGAAVFELGRAVLAVTGPLRQKFLHGILSNEVAGRADGQGSLCTLLDAKGHVLALMRVLVGADTVWLELPADRLDEVERLLAHYRVAAPVRFARPAAAVLAVAGPAARDALARAGAEVPDLRPEDHVSRAIAGAPTRVGRASDLPARGVALHVAADAAAAVRDALLAAGAASIGASTVDALRVEEGIAWYGRDVTEANLLHEAGLVRRYHSPPTGCYIGQENIARLEARGGNVNKALRGLRLGGPAAAGDVITAEGAEVGRVTTAAVSPRLGPVAMGYVHRSRSEPGTRVEVAGAEASVAALPLLDGDMGPAS
jgi:folate-binding protein YgfZ